MSPNSGGVAGIKTSTRKGSHQGTSEQGNWPLLASRLKYSQYSQTPPILYAAGVPAAPLKTHGEDKPLLHSRRYLHLHQPGDFAAHPIPAIVDAPNPFSHMTGNYWHPRLVYFIRLAPHYTPCQDESKPTMAYVVDGGARHYPGAGATVATSLSTPELLSICGKGHEGTVRTIEIGTATVSQGTSM